MAAFVAILVYLHSSAFRHSMERRAESWLTQQTGREARLRLENLRPLLLRTDIAEGRIAGGVPGTAFVELDRGRIDLRVWPLLSGRVAISELDLNGLAVNLAQAPSTEADPGAPGEPLPSFADLLDRVSIDRGALTGSAIRLGDDSWPVEIDARGIEWNVRRTAPSGSYRLSLDVREGTARVAGGDWFAVDAKAEADLDAAGLRVSDLLLTAPGAEVRGGGTLDDLPSFTGSVDASGNWTLESLPWPPGLAPERRGTGAVATEVDAQFTGSDVVLEARLTSRRLGLGSFSAEDVDWRLSGANGAWTSDFELGVSGARVRGSLGGRMASDPAPLEARVSWSVADVAALAGLLGDEAGLPLRGRLEGELTGRAEALRADALAGRFSIVGSGLGPRPEGTLAIASRLEGAFAEGEVVLERISARGGGLALSGDGRADLANRTELNLRLEREGSAGEALAGLFAILKALGVETGLPPEATRLDGDFEATARLRGPGLERVALDSVSGDLVLMTRGLTAAGPEGLPIDANLDLGLALGRVTLRTAELRGPGTQLALDGSLGTESLDAEVVFDAASGTATRLLNELTALGIRDSVPLRDVVARTGDLHLDARLSGPWRTLDGTANVKAQILAAHADTAERTLTGEARFFRGAWDATLRLDGGPSFLVADLNADAYDRWPLPGFARFELFEASPDFWVVPSGPVTSLSGRIAAAGTVDLDSLRIQAVADVTEGAFGGRAFELNDGTFTIEPGRVAVEGARIQVLGGAVDIDGVLGDPGTAGLRIRAKSLHLGEVVRAIGAESAVGGAVDLELTLTGTTVDPRVQGRLETHGLAVGDQRLTDLAGGLEFAEGLLEFDLSGTDGSVAVLAGAVRTGSPQTWSITTNYPLRLDLSRFTAAAEDGPLDFEARIVADLAGNGADVNGIEGAIEFHEARVAVGGDAFVPRDVPVVTLGGGQARLAPFRIDVAGAALDFQAQVALDLDAAMSVSVDGELPLRSLSTQLPGARLDGTAELALRITGTPALPEWRGELKIREGRLNHPDLPAPFEHVQAALTLAPEVWRVDSLELQLGGGKVTGSGTYRPAVAERPGDLQLLLEGKNVRLPPIEGLRSQFDAEVELSGNPAVALTLAGRLTFERAVYGTDIDLQRELLSKVRIVDRVDEVGGVLDRLRLDLDVQAPGTLFVRNNLASLTTSASLHIGGTAADPLVTGRVELQEGGRVLFRDVTYNVAQGTLNYTSDPPDNPRLDIEGRTTVGNYDISLLVSGRLEDPQVDLTSAPPLAQADIVSLLVTGKTRDDLNSSGAGMSETQAALYLGQGITREIERTLERSLGLDQVTLDPALVAAEDDPAARLTVGKALTGRLFASYSREFGGSQGDIYQMRFTPLERLSLLAQQDDTGELLTEAVYQRKFYTGPKRAEPPASAATAGERIVRVGFQGVRSLSEKRVARSLGVRARDRFRRSDLLDGLDAIRDLYLERGFPEARVDATTQAEEGGLAVLVEIEEGRRVDIRVAGPLRGKLKSAVMDLWQQSVFRDEIAGDARERAVEVLAAHGFVEATVETRLVESSSEQVELFLDVVEGRRVRIDRIVLEGNRAIDDATIRQQFLSLGDSLLRRDWLRPALLAEDREAVRSLYAGRGYLDVKVAPPRVTYPRGPAKARVEIAIEEGPRYEVGTVAFSGNAAYDEARLRDLAGLSQGLPYLEADVRLARSRLRAFYDAEGYSGTLINVTRVADRDRAQADLKFEIAEAPKAVIESIRIDNPGLTLSRVIDLEVDLKPGDPLSADKLARTRQELYRTGLFRSVTVVERPGETAEGRQLELTLDERANLRTQLGLGYGTDQGVRGSASLSHSNLGGARLFGSAGARASRTDWRLYGLLRQPNVLRTQLQGLASSSIEQEQQASFDVRRKSTSVQLEPEASDEPFRWFVGYKLQEADIFRDGVEIDPDSDEVTDLSELIDLRTDSTVRLAEVNVGLTAGRRDDFAWPTRGNLLHAKFSLFDNWFLSEADFAKAEAQWSVYRPLGSGWIWSAGVRLGLAEPRAGQDAIPLSERFFVGGDSSLRGFGRDAIVPVGFPQQQFEDAGIEVTSSLGGEASLILNQELIVPFYHPLALVLFYDAANIYWQRSDFDPGDLRHGAGLGLRVRTPVGPIRLEYGWKLDRQATEDGGRFHFSIGIPF